MILSVGFDSMSSKIFEEFLISQCSYISKKENFKISYDPASTKAAVILEPRKHPLFEAVLRNIMYHLGEGWNLHIWSRPSNKDWIDDLLPGWEFVFHSIPFSNMNQTLYNGYLMNPLFWESFTEEHVLVFQTDCIMFHPFQDRFLSYDYIGANYYHPFNISKRIGGIQGGFSLRKKSAMLKCLKDVSWTDLPNVANHNEDVFFTHACDLLGLQTPPVEIRKEFSIEAEWYETPMAHHGFQHPYFSSEQAKAIISQSAMHPKLFDREQASCLGHPDIE